MKGQLWKNGNSGNKMAFLIFGRKAHWIEDKGTYNLIFHICSGHFWMFQTKLKFHYFLGALFPHGSDILTLYSLKYPPKHWYYLGFSNNISYFQSTNKFYTNRESTNLHFQEGHMTCILTTLYGFPCIEKQKIRSQSLAY